MFQRGRQARVPHAVRCGFDFHWLGQVNAPKHNAGIGGSRAQGESDLLAGMQANPGCPDHVFQGALFDHVFAPLIGSDKILPELYALSA
jgi:hypothetical protein